MKGVERRSQLYSRECDWLGPDLTRNTQGRYIPIFPVAAVMLTLPGHNTLYIYLLLANKFSEVIIIFICSVVNSVT